jgi:hypothetical protein
MNITSFQEPVRILKTKEHTVPQTEFQKLNIDEINKSNKIEKSITPNEKSKK